MQQTNPNLRVFRYRDLRDLGYGGRQTIWRQVRAGKFPAPVDVGGRPGWTEAMLLDVTIPEGGVSSGKIVEKFIGFQQKD